MLDLVVCCGSKIRTSRAQDARDWMILEEIAVDAHWKPAGALEARRRTGLEEALDCPMQCRKQ